MKAYIGRYPKDSSKQRKVSIRIDKWDSWNADQTIAMVAYPLLVQLKATKHGAPCVDDEDVPEELRSYNSEQGEDEYDVDSNHFARWDYVLGEMIFAMQELSEGCKSEEQFFDWSNCKEEGSLQEQLEGLKVDDEGLQAYMQRVDKGCRLLGKYFRALWD